MGDFYPGETMGVEIESDNVFGKYLKLPRGFTLVNDASVNTNASWNLNGIPVEVPAEINLDGIRINGLRQETKGTEIVSNTPLKLNDPQLLDLFNQIVLTLIQNGESGWSERAGIHFHITLPPSLRILKEVINVGRHLEDLFFWIGGMGYEFRGIKNDSTYCRPITKFGPQCVKVNNGYTQCFDVNDLLVSTSVEDFKVRYGDIYSQMGDKYIPVRYSWLNLYSIFKHGSLEFRLFNITSNGWFIYLASQLCGAFVKMVLKRAFSGEDFVELSENSVYDHRPDIEIINTFYEFFGSDLEPDVLNGILTILEVTPRVILPEEYVYSHLMFLERGDITKRHFRVNNYSPPKIKKNLIKIPKFVDQHNLTNNTTQRNRIVPNPERIEALIRRYRIDLPVPVNDNLDNDEEDIIEEWDDEEEDEN